eukprot:TRINITY_DN10067_c0_g1_i1.p2 TRINITY_DN10067_c0_g1~~TRINITY_DN10067_c0_g1_i1.p2  ORF type:complete len:110 (+),score=25.66 TRINITY_DN10067_c0_g1_i1:130-459(+)
MKTKQAKGSSNRAKRGRKPAGGPTEPDAKRPRSDDESATSTADARDVPSETAEQPAVDAADAATAAAVSDERPVVATADAGGAAAAVDQAAPAGGEASDRRFTRSCRFV